MSSFYPNLLEENHTHSPSATLVIRVTGFLDVMIQVVMESDERKLNGMENNVKKR